MVNFVFFPQAIHEKILSLDFSEVHARIKQVDSQATLKDGIVVQVSVGLLREIKRVGIDKGV